ncbi:hypothetical protein JQ600_35420 [Bradyrhizobium sp. AUGA SZCCT0176]|uniref:hypothetical protein n=1 Tax=Bradyrhizobium sp. AUGA SZCCT0176 TaxID=2807664 RepID=UPI001BA71950|nr:hypothetical protein [Bradyrhizobium sp. AUGA SZCCT0176]MBR1230187.1 hypothetical protein [Bradyrhizobium sp. AUGA SZCCT0176]
MPLYLRKVDHPQAVYNWRVILKIDETEYEVGSIGPQRTADVELQWGWGIDTVIPMRAMATSGRGSNLKDCMAKFKAAWERFSSDEANLTAFLEAKRRAKRG